MGRFAGTAQSAMLVVGIVAMGFAFSGASAGSAEAAAKKTKAAAPAAPASAADQAKQQSAQTRQAYEAGIKSFSGGKYQPAVDELSGALRGGGLGSAEMAKALYVRGLAYKKLNKTGLAISDLTSALWLKNGLGESDQKNAISERAEAYRLAGLGDGNSGTDQVVVANPNPTPAGAKASEPVVAAAAPAAATVVPAAAAHTAKKKNAPQQAAAAPPPPSPVAEVTRQSPDAANARKLASTPVETGGLQAAAAGSLVADTPRAAAVESAAPQAAVAADAVVPAVAAPAALATPAIPAPIPTAVSQTATAAAPVLSAAPIETAAAPASAATSGLSLPSSVTGFFSNMFSGGAKPAQTQASASPITTASTTPAPPAVPTAVGAAPLTGQKSAALQTSPAAAAAPMQAAAAQPKGKYKLHIAAVRSRAEAEALAQKLAAQNGAALKNRAPVVDEAVIGSMGTFYRVRVGSYATADEPRGVCNTLRTSGFDCLVVTN
jgi:SPOR domain